MAPAPTRKDTWRVSLAIDGDDWGVWDSKTGGKINGNGLTYKPGDMGPQVSLGGNPTVDTVTVGRLYDRVRDHDRLQTLVNRVGKARVNVKARPKDTDGNAYGRTIIWSGLLDGLQTPDIDSTSRDAAMITLDITPDGPVVLA